MATKQELRDEITALGESLITQRKMIMDLESALEKSQRDNAGHIAENHRLGYLFTQGLLRRILLAIRFPGMRLEDIVKEFDKAPRRKQVAKTEEVKL